MKKITEKELSLLKLKKSGNKPGTNNPVLIEASKLDVGEILLVQKEDWLCRADISMRFSAFGRLTKKKFRTNQLDSEEGGWIITRLI